MHEYTHHLQDAMPELQQKFQQLHERRTMGEELKPLRSLYKKDEKPLAYAIREKGRRDNYIDVYFGKEYDPSGALEVWTMGMQYVAAFRSHVREDGLDHPDVLEFLAPFRQKELFDKDRELFDFIVGVLFHYDP